MGSSCLGYDDDSRTRGSRRTKRRSSRALKCNLEQNKDRLQDVHSKAQQAIASRLFGCVSAPWRACLGLGHGDEIIGTEGEILQYSTYTKIEIVEPGRARDQCGRSDWLGNELNRSLNLTITKGDTDTTKHRITTYNKQTVYKLTCSRFSFSS